MRQKLLGNFYPMHTLDRCGERATHSVRTRFQDRVFGGFHEVEDLADDVSLQAADDVAFAEAFGGAAGDVIEVGWWNRIRTITVR